jgi:hypothetical protein
MMGLCNIQLEELGMSDSQSMALLTTMSGRDGK